MEYTDQDQTGKRGSDLNFNAQISLEQAAQGTTLPIKIPSLETCSICYGKGILEENTKCRTCKGQGKFTTEKSFNINIPPGIKDGERLCMLGQGESGTGGASAGDLYVTVTIRQHYLFQRDGNNLYYTTYITSNQLGTSIDIPTLYGETTKIELPATISGETVITIHGKGMPLLGQSTNGDLFVRININDPAINKQSKTNNLTNPSPYSSTYYPTGNQYIQPYPLDNNSNDPHQVQIPNQSVNYQDAPLRPTYIDQYSDFSSHPNNHTYGYSPYNNLGNMQLQKGSPYPTPYPQPLIADDNFWDRTNNQIKSYAMLSFAFSVLGLFCFGIIIGPVSFLLSSKALKLIDDHNIGHIYKPWALAGKYLGILSFIINSILLLFILFNG
jgi:hypothetical protein